MTYIPPIDQSAPAHPRLPRLLDPAEVRILGSLMEKQMATPEYYPLTLNALVAACNQKTNREPVMELTDTEVEAALGRLQDEKLVWRVVGGRAQRFDHNLDRLWSLARKEKAILTLLMLRGPQTPGELRGRSERLESFATVSEVEEILREMAAHSEPLVAEQDRKGGQKETRWTTTIGLAGARADADEPRPEEAQLREPLAVRVQRLENRVEELTRRLDELQRMLE